MNRVRGLLRDELRHELRHRTKSYVPKEQGEMHRVHERKETALIRGDLLEMTAGPGNRRRWVPVNVHESADAVIGRSGSPIEGPNGKKG